MAACSYAAGPEADTTRVGIVYAAFLVLETAIGMYFPAMSFAKSQVIPESHRANVMNWFRVPMNVVTCAALLCLHIESVANDKRVVFAFCLGMALFGVIMATKFMRMEPAPPSSNDQRRNVDDDVEKQTLLNEEEN